MFTTLDQERREYEELCKNNPNYPKDFELHRKYQRIIKKWKPLIENNDPIIYSDWSRYRWKWSESFNETPYRVMSYLLNYPASSKPTLTLKDLNYTKTIQLYRSVHQDHNMRYNAIIVLLQQFTHVIENTSDVSGWKLFGYPKKYLVDFIQSIDRRGCNPFDYFYSAEVISNRDKKWVVPVTIVTIVVIVVLHLLEFLYGSPHE